MRVRWTAVGIAAVMVVVGLTIAFTRTPPTEEEILNRTLSKVSESVDREWVNRIVGVLHEDYSDDMGNSRASLRSSMAQAFWGPRGFELLWDHARIVESTEETLVADLNFEIQQYEGESLVSTHRGVLHVTFQKDGRRLQVVRVEGLEDIAKSVEASYGA